MSDRPEAEPDPESRVVELRRASLERAGYDPQTAEELAGRLDIHLQDALALRRAGSHPMRPSRCSRRRTGPSSEPS